MGTASWAHLTANWAEHNCRLAAVLARKSGSSGRRIVAELERERERIARDLHAGAGQPLSGIQVCLELVDQFVQNPNSGNQTTATEAVTRLRWLAAEALGQVRAVSHLLHPPDWQSLPLSGALRRLVDGSGLAQLLECDLRLAELPQDLPHEVQVVAYRCAQEAIANVVRHAGASRVEIEASCDGEFIHLQIVDNGKGFQPAPSGGGIGLRTMKWHAESVGGHCEVQSGPGGTAIRIRLPVAGE